MGSVDTTLRRGRSAGRAASSAAGFCPSAPVCAILSLKRACERFSSILSLKKLLRMHKIKPLIPREAMDMASIEAPEMLRAEFLLFHLTFRNSGV